MGVEGDGMCERERVGGGECEVGCRKVQCTKVQCTKSTRENPQKVHVQGLWTHVKLPHHNTSSHNQRYIRGETARDKRVIMRRLGVIVYANVFRCSVSLVAASTAAGVGSVLAGPYPGFGASASFLLADTVSQLVLVPHLLAR